MDVSLAPTEGGMGHEAARAATTCIRCCKARAHTHLPFLVFRAPHTAHCALQVHTTTGGVEDAADGFGFGREGEVVTPSPKKSNLPIFLKNDKKEKRKKKDPSPPEREREASLGRGGVIAPPLQKKNLKPQTSLGFGEWVTTPSPLLPPLSQKKNSN